MMLVIIFEQNFSIVLKEYRFFYVLDHPIHLVFRHNSFIFPHCTVETPVTKCLPLLPRETLINCWTTIFLRKASLYSDSFLRFEC